MIRTLLAFLFGLSLAAQVQGHLSFAATGHKTVQLDLVDGGHPAFITIPFLQGEAQQLRLFVLSHAGPEKMVLPPETKAKPVKGAAPAAWKVDHNGSREQVATSYATFWRYTPGLVLPVKFRIGNVEWHLAEAFLPPKMLVGGEE